MRFVTSCSRNELTTSAFKKWTPNDRTAERHSKTNVRQHVIEGKIRVNRSLYRENEKKIKTKPEINIKR